jgi:DNA repair exonuclease SbcCD nuclease subunit
VLGVAEKGKHTIVVAGDIFHRVNPPSEIIAVWFGWLNECKRRKVDVWQIAGNHDSGVDWINLAMVKSAELPNVTVVSVASSYAHDIDGMKVHFLPHLPAKTQDSAIEKFGSLDKFLSETYKSASIVIGHGMVRGTAYANDIFFEAGNALEIAVENFPICNLMVLGHIHNQTEIKGKPRVIYPGSLTVNNFGEVNETKGYVQIGSVNSKEISIKEFQSETTPWKDITVDLTTKDETEIDEDLVANVAEGAIIKITVLADDPLAVNESYIRNLFNRYGHVSRFETKATDKEAVEETVIGMDKTHEELLSEYLEASDGKGKALAMKMGKKIISEVLA